MGKFLKIWEKRASFLHIPIKMGIPKKMGRFPFIVEHVAFAKRASFLQIL